MEAIVLSDGGPAHQQIVSQLIDAGRHLNLPVLVLWGAQGTVGRCFDPLAEWQKVATDVRGQALPCGHYIGEEVPELLLEHVLPFLR